MNKIQAHLNVICSTTPSPARDNHENSDKLDQILTKLTSLTADNMRLEAKFDSFAFSINCRLDNMKTEFDGKIAMLSADTTSTSITLHNLVRAVTDDLSHLKTELNALKSQVNNSTGSASFVSPSALPSSSTRYNPPSSIASVAKEIAARNLRRKNIFITGLPCDSTKTDGAIVRSLLADELNLLGNSLFTCRRVGKLSFSPQALIVSFDDVRFRDQVMSNAKKLRSSTNNFIKGHVYISPDLTELERNEQFVMRQELRSRQKAGENVIISRGKIIPRASLVTHRTSASSISALPLTVNLP